MIIIKHNRTQHKIKIKLAQNAMK